MKRLEGKTALVTGASRGIGKSIAMMLASEGAKVAVNYASNDAAAKDVKAEIDKLGGDCLLLKANLGDARAARSMVKQAAEHYGHLDILVNNAGITKDSLLPRMTDEQWVDVIQVNLNGCFFCTSAAIPFMTKQGYGRIVNISSMNGQIAAMGQANYSASKGGMIAFTRTAATELARYGITVNTVAPGYTETDMFAAVPPAIQAQIKSRIPLARFAHPEEIAKAVIFLVADGDYITGEQINVNGGAYEV